MDQFNRALINASIEQQNKEAKRKAINSYVDDLVRQGVDKEIAKAMAKSFYDCGLIKAM